MLNRNKVKGGTRKAPPPPSASAEIYVKNVLFCAHSLSEFREYKREMGHFFLTSDFEIIWLGGGGGVCST